MFYKNPPQHNKIFGKMYKRQHSLQHLELMNNLGNKIQASCNASLPYIQSYTDESYSIVTPKIFSSMPKNSFNKGGQSEFFDRRKSTIDQDENISQGRFIVINDSKPNWECCNEAGDKSRVRSKRSFKFRSHTSWLFCFLNVLFLSTICHANPDRCAAGINTPGRTWPQGDIVLEYEQSLSIYCMLNDTLTNPEFQGKNASDLVFFRNQKEMEPEYITIINETTIKLYVEKPLPSKDMYYCKLRMSGDYSEPYAAVCLNNVIVGSPPKEPLSFGCVSQNWENLTCTWEPAPNYITTHFSLRFKLPGRIGGRVLFACPVPKAEQKLPPNTCMWDVSTDPLYRQVHENFMFILTAENVLGTRNFSYKIHHFAHVIPAKPVNLSVANKTYSSALLYWKVPYPMDSFPPGLHHKVSYQNQWDRLKAWETRNITNDKHAREIYYNLTDLQYANAIYDVRVFMKSAMATGEDSWSQFSDLTFKTSATCKPPKTDVGSFEIAGNSGHRDVYIYWQTIPAYLENGDSFRYQVVHVEENGKKVDLQPQEKTKTYAKFKGLSFNSFRFEIVTANIVGANQHKAVVYVPSQMEMPREPVAFTKIAFEGGLYELSWNPPSNSDITNYTIFWCENDRDRPYQCSGYLDWVHVSRNTSVYNATVPEPKKVYQFAIAANTARASSGMVWASCTAIHNKVVGKMKSVWINRIQSNLIEVGWKLECSDRIDIVKGFNIYYCPITSPYNLTCKGPKMNTTIRANPRTIHGIVHDLKPYTTYMLTVAVLTENGEGLHSDPLYNTTLEAAPSPPLNVKVSNITNTTMTVEWLPPSTMNGVLRYYLVYYNQNWTNVEKETSVVITGLEPHTVYNITVLACTVQCSNYSSPVFNKTGIGIPGKLDVPIVRFMNSSQVRIVWNAPKIPAGYLEYYEISTADGYIHTNITTNDKYLSIPDCKSAGREKMYRFRVRAVNFGENKERLVGPWSEAGEGNCYSNGPSSVVWIVIWIIGSLSGVAFLLFLGYTSKRLWIKCKAMQDVEVKLPPGLASNVKLLPDKGTDRQKQQLSADSSGCSSGQESVTSSLTSDSHVSTDSGADLDPVPMSPTKLLDSPPTWESSSLRQRNVTGTKPDSCTDHDRWDPYVRVDKTADIAASDSLSLARSTPNLLADGNATINATGLYASPQQHAWSSTGYISMPSSEDDSSNNPSPLPRGKGTTQEVYSIVGLAPLPASRTRGERSHSQTVNLIPLGSEVRMVTVDTANPYVSLASLEQKTRNTAPLHMPSLGDFEDMDVVQPIRKEEEEEEQQQQYQYQQQQEQQQQQQQQRQLQQNQQQPFSISDKISKPYVQTGLMDTSKKLRSLNNLDDPKSQKTKYIARRKSPYVAVSTLASALDAPSSTDRETIRSIDDGNSPSSYPFSSQLIDTSKPVVHKLGDADDPVTRSTTCIAGSLPVVKQTSGYVTIAENPTCLKEHSVLESSSLPYVPHQRVNKKSPHVQQNVDQADEQYSKVTVVPTTM